MRPTSACAALALALAGPALAEPLPVKDGRIEFAVSGREMNRIAVAGEKVSSIRKIDDPAGPKMLVEADAVTGDVYVAFDAPPAAGKTFSAFLVTETGRTVQVVLAARDEPGQTVTLSLGEGAVPRAARPVAQAGAAADDPAAAAEDSPPRSGLDGPAAPRREGYTETLTALIRLMFNGVAPPGVDHRTVNDRARRAGAFELRTLDVYAVAGLRGSVLSLRNTTQVSQPLASKTFLVSGVLAAAVSHEDVAPGGYARVYLVEGGAP